MGYLTVEVEIDHGRVIAKSQEALPEKASGLLTIFQSETQDTANTQLQALETLQKHFRLDPVKAVEWMTSVREARH